MLFNYGEHADDGEDSQLKNADVKVAAEAAWVVEIGDDDDDVDDLESDNDDGEADGAANLDDDTGVYDDEDIAEVEAMGRSASVPQVFREKRAIN